MQYPSSIISVSKKSPQKIEGIYPFLKKSTISTAASTHRTLANTPLKKMKGIQTVEVGSADNGGTERRKVISSKMSIRVQDQFKLPATPVTDSKVEIHY